MINKENWKENYTHISNEAIDNEKVLRVIKSGKIKYIYTKDELIGKLKILLAGKAAEEVKRCGVKF